MRTKDRGSRRSFTVEVKSGERGATKIPSRIAAPVRPTPRAFADAFSETPAAPAVPVDSRRILPSLIVAEPEPIPKAAAPRRKRGRPRKVQPAPPEPIAKVEAVEPAAPQAAAPSASPARTTPRRAAVKPDKQIPAGERWKRRLGRWSR